MNGDGVKKDLYKAAYYFRLADAQGFGLVGNSWIYKDKYDSIMPQTLE
jgi:TPR repeat protein